MNCTLPECEAKQNLLPLNCFQQVFYHSKKRNWWYVFVLGIWCTLLGTILWVKNNCEPQFANKYVFMCWKMTSTYNWDNVPIQNGGFSSTWDDLHVECFPPASRWDHLPGMLLQGFVLASALCISGIILSALTLVFMHICCKSICVLISHLHVNVFVSLNIFVF